MSYKLLKQNKAAEITINYLSNLIQTYRTK